MHGHFWHKEMHIECSLKLKEAMTQFMHLNFSSLSFEIHVNLLHP